MTVHSKTRRRVRILVVSAVVLTVTAAAAYVIRKKQIAEQVVRNRDAGYAALESGDYFSAMHKIGPYVQRNPTDVTALARYAAARRNVEEPNGKHLVDAISLYRRTLELQPDHPEAREKLLEIYLATGFNTEIVAATENRTDPPSLRARAVALANLKRDADGLATAERYLQAKPDDLRMQMFVVSMHQRAGRPEAEIVESVQKLAEAHPNDPRYDLLMGFTYGVLDRMDESLKYTLKAAAQPLSDPEHVEIAVSMLDSLGREDEALALLVRAAEAGILKDVRALLARLYQSRKFDLVIDRVARLQAADAKLKADLVAHRAMSLLALEKDEEAKAVIAELAARQNDFAATAWANVLNALPRAGQPADDRKIIQACRDGLRGEADNPYFRLYLGDAYGRLGETDLAMIEWSRAAEGARVWGEPIQRLLQVVMATGQTETTRAMAERLRRLSRDDPRALALVAAAQARLTNRQDAASVAELSAIIDQVQQLRAGEPGSLQLMVSLLAVTDRKEDARRVITDALSADKTLPLETYLALVAASEANKLELEQASLDRARQVHGESFELAFANAAWLVRAGRGAEAVAALAAAREKAADRDAVRWRLAEAQLLEEVRDERAAKAWAALADAEPENAAVQRAALAAASVQSDRELKRRAIDRLRAAVGDEGMGWRLAEARWVLDGAAQATAAADRERELVKATSLLNDLANRFPEQLAVRVMLADCLIRLDKRQDAITHLTAAVRLAPGSFSLSAQLASLLQSVGDYDRAKPYLEQAERILERSNSLLAIDTAGAGGGGAGGAPAAAVAGSEMTAEAAWRLISSLYANRGDAPRAVEILEKLGGQEAGDTDLAMAQILARRGELSDEACQKLLAKPTLATIEIVAEQYTRVGRPTEAEAALARLDGVEAKPGERELLRGLYRQRRGEFPAAIPDLEASTRATPSLAAAWRALLESQAMDGRGDDAAATATRAAAAVPDDPAFRRLSANEQLIRETATTPRLRPLLAALAGETDDADALLSALKIAREANATNKTVSEVLAAMRPVADRAPRLAVLQYLIADLHQAAGNNEEAVAVVTRIMQFLPTDPLPAQRATELLAAGGRWDEMIAAAQTWRARLGAASRPADEALATAYLATGRFSEALAQLEPYAANAAGSPADWSQALLLRARALVGLRRTAEAEAILFPALSPSAALRGGTTQIAVAGIEDPAVAERWLEQVRAATPAAAMDEQLMLARALQELAARAPDAGLKAKVDARVGEVAQALAAATDGTPDQWLTLGMIQEIAGDLPGAEASYRRTLAADAKQVIARNNLAMLLIRKEGGDVAEALAFATEAAADPNQPGHPEFLDTLAQVQAKAGQHAAAEATLRRALELAPNGLEIRANLVQVLLDGGKPGEAKQALDALEGMPESVAARRANPQFDARLKALSAGVAAANGRG